MPGLGRRKVDATRGPAARVPAALVPLGAALLILAPAVVVPQVLYGTLTGNVTDPTGALVAGARVQVLNVGTNVARTATTDERGGYLFSDLQPGVYDVTIEAAAFQPFVRKGFRIEATAVLRIDARLQVGGIAEAVEVTAATPVLQTDRADVHITQSARQVNDLPLTGSVSRNYQSLMQIVPGAVLAGEQNSEAGSPQRSISFNVNGVSRLQNNTKLDGASVTYVWLPTNTAYVPSAEAIEEVSIVTNAFNAQQGMVGGAAVNVITKSGTNRFKGTAWIYNVDSDLKARNYFQTPPQGYATWDDWDAADEGTRPPKNNPDKLNQFGVNLGGPIIKDKLFFFVNWERFDRKRDSPQRLVSIATDALRRGDFSGTAVTIYDPASNPDPTLRTPFPGNIIPADRIDPGSQWLIDRMPPPNVAGAAFVNNFTAKGKISYKRDNFDAKVNYNASSKLQFFAKFSYSPSLIFDGPILGDAGGDSIGGGQPGEAPGDTYLAGIGGTYTLRPNLLLDVNLGYTHQKLGAEYDLDRNYGLEDMGIPGTNGPDRLQGGIPSFQITNWSNMGNPNTGNPFQFDDKQYVATVSLQWMKGAHALRFGYEYQNQQMNHFQPQGGTFQTARGTFQFNGNMTRLQNGPTPSDLRFNSWADFLLGLPSGAGKVVQLRNPNSFHMLSHAAYVQDAWQATRRLTVNLGLRWEIYPFPTRGGGLGVSRFDPDDGNVYNGGVGGVPVDTGASSGSGQLLPRAGVVFRLNDKTVLRAGYGHSSDVRPFIDFRNAYPINNAWAHPTGTYNGVTNAFVPVTTLRQGLNEALYGQAPDLSQGVVKLPVGAGTTTYPKEPDRRYIQSWNVMAQREITSWLSGQVGYVGTLVRGQMGFVNINTSAPGTGNAGRALAQFGLTQDINMIKPFGDATYNGLQVELRARGGNGQLGVVYTLSRAENYQDNDSNPRIPYPPEKERNKGLAGFDRTHNLQTYWVYNLPFGKGQRWATSGLGDAVFGGWQFNGILQVMSGTPINIVQGSGGNLNAAGSGQYPDLVKDEVAIYPDNLKKLPSAGGAGADPNNYQYFDRSAFAVVSIPSGQPQRFGTSPRNPIRGPGFWNVDLGLFKAISLPKGLEIQLRIEAINAFNHPNFLNPGADISNAGTFGFITSTVSALGAGQAGFGTGERTVRFGARLSF
jgi:outer membrane receptor protein involved in Fe transport